MRHRSYGGRLTYRHDRLGERGGESFSVTVQPDGTRTLRAVCELAEEELLRDVIYTVDGSWQPQDAYVRLTVAGHFRGASWFRFDDAGAECEGVTTADGRFRQRVDLGHRPRLFAPHPVVSDGWQAAAYDFGRGPGMQRLEDCANSSSRPDGGSGPLLDIVYKDLEYLADEPVDVPAGRFEGRRMKIHPRQGAMAGWPPLEFWVTGEDHLLLRLRWDLLQTTYELVELEGDAR